MRVLSLVVVVLAGSGFRRFPTVPLYVSFTVCFLDEVHSSGILQLFCDQIPALNSSAGVDMSQHLLAITTMCSGGHETRTAGLGGSRLFPPHLSAKVWNAEG